MGNELDIRGNKLFCSECGEPMHVKRIGEEFPNFPDEHIRDSILETVTLVGYASPTGHDHNSNCRNRQYICPKKHVTIVSKLNRCPACDWVQHSTCGCHDGVKLNEWPDI